ncbi:MAG: PAS domain-containing protein [Kiloniellales bacterium]
MSFFDLIDEPPVRDLFTYWLGLRQDGALPLKSAIRPENMPRSVLPNVFIFVREADGRLRCRLSGTAITHFYGFEATGKYLDDLVPPEVRENRLEIFHRPLATRLPIYYIGRVVTEGRDHWRIARLLLPASSDGAAADILLGAVAYRAASDHVFLESGPRAPAHIVKLVEATEDDLRAS